MILYFQVLYCGAEEVRAETHVEWEADIMDEDGILAHTITVTILNTKTSLNLNLKAKLFIWRRACEHMYVYLCM